MSYYFSIGNYQSPIIHNLYDYGLLTDEENLLLASIDVMYKRYADIYSNEMQIFSEVNGWEMFNYDSNEACYEQFKEGLIRIAGWATADAIVLGINFAASSLGTFGVGAPVAAVATLIGTGMITVKLASDVIRLYSDYSACEQQNNYQYIYHYFLFTEKYYILNQTINMFVLN